MRKITFYGSSDDLIEIEGAPGADEYYADTDREEPEGRFIVGGKILVMALYDKNGCWSFSLGQLHEDVPFPDWPISFRQHENGYSVELTIEAPDDAIVCRISY